MRRVNHERGNEMKTGLTLQEMAQELERQREAKHDYLVDTRKLRFSVGTDGVALSGLPGGEQSVRRTAHQQFASLTGIPKPYYDRMASDAPDLLAENLNHWLETQPKKRLVRTIDGSVRAILSDRYRALDNYDLAMAVLPKLGQLEATVQSTDITEDRFYLKAVTERISGEVKQGDRIQAGIVVSNSEVGRGRLSIQEMDYRLVCTNGMIRAHVVKKTHLGRSGFADDALEDAREFFRDETRMLEDKAFFHKLQDAASAMFDEGRFMERLHEYSNAAQQQIEADPVETVQEIGKRMKLNDSETSGVLKHLITGGDLSKWGAANAITRYSQDVESYDRATELEAIGGDVIELSPQEWSKVAV